MRGRHGRRGLLTILAVWAAALVLLLGAVPGLAASEDTQDVLDRLAHLQRVQIEPEWLPDIRANESAVQALLDSYLGLTLAERRELTAENRTALRAYFEALYEVQGKDTEAVSVLFDDTTAAPSGAASRAGASSGAASSRAASGTQGASGSQGAASSSGAAASSRAGSGASSSSATTTSSSAASAVSDPSGAAAGGASASGASGSAPSTSQAGTSSLPVDGSAAIAPVTGSDVSGDASGADSSTGIPAAAQPPQGPGDDGWLAVFGNSTLGTALLMVLAVLAATLFVRFLVALRKAKKEGAVQAHVDARAQEMFGESYDPVDDPMDKDFIAPPPADFLDTAPAPLADGETPFDDEADEAAPAGSFAMFAPQNAPDALKKEGFFARRKREKAEREATEELDELRQEVFDRVAEQKGQDAQGDGEAGAAPRSQDGPSGSSAPSAQGAASSRGTLSAANAPSDGAAGSTPGAKSAQAADAPRTAKAQGENRSPFAPPGGAVSRFDKAFGEDILPKAEEEKPLPKEAEPLFTANPDRRNSITTRSFSAAPRTGRPGKMTFRQGDPDDLDGVDE